MVSAQEIQEFADAIAREFHPERIILFGSYAWGKPDMGSDVNILVLMRTREAPPRAATEITYHVAHDFALDLIVRDPDVVERRLALGDWFLKEITERGKVLYESAYA
jgi:predicted nucleotidyltransferase